MLPVRRLLQGNRNTDLDGRIDGDAVPDGGNELPTPERVKQNFVEPRAVSSLG